MDKKVTKSMSVKILNINKGLIEYDDVKYIRIKSRYYNLMIMKDYLPIIGEIDGDIKFELVNDTIKLSNIKGYFMNKQNHFKLFIKEVLQTKIEEENNANTKDKVKLKPRINDIEDDDIQDVEDMHIDEDILEKNNENTIDTDENNENEMDNTVTNEIDYTLINEVKKDSDEIGEKLVEENTENADMLDNELPEDINDISENENSGEE